MPEPPLPTSSSTGSLEKKVDQTSTEDVQPVAAPSQKKDLRFRFVFVAICVSVFTSALEIVSRLLYLTMLISKLRLAPFRPKCRRS